jgi:hypothetical protein
VSSHAVANDKQCALLLRHVNDATYILVGASYSRFGELFVYCFHIAAFIVMFCGKYTLYKVQEQYFLHSLRLCGRILQPLWYEEWKYCCSFAFENDYAAWGVLNVRNVLLQGWWSSIADTNWGLTV